MLSPSCPVPAPPSPPPTHRNPCPRPQIVRMEPGDSAFAPMIEVVYLPGSEDWDYAKFCFRSTLFSLVTIVVTLRPE